MGVLKLLLLLPFGLACSVVQSQKFSSKMYTVPILLNPANTGRFIADYRIAGVSRNEINGLSNDLTYSFSFDTRILKSALQEQDKIAVGMVALSESDRYFGLFNKSVALSLAYFKGLDENGKEQLGIGFQTNFVTKTHESPTYVFEDQLINAANSGFAGISFTSKKVTVNYFDFNAGVYYQNLKNSKHLYSLGLGILHTTRPYKIFDGGEFTLLPEITLQAGSEVLISEKDKISTNINITLNSENLRVLSFSLGCLYELAIGQGQYKIGGGTFFRNEKLYGTAFAPCLALKLTNLNIAVSYDLSVTKPAFTQRNALEVGIVHTGMFITKKKM